jgi:predicted metal-binding protein
MEPRKIGIIICNRYAACAGGKCFRALRNREGAFSSYQECEVDLVGYTSCGGCPGGNIEYAPAEMIRNGVEIIHLATGMIVGYPPCPRLSYFVDFLKQKYGVDVRIGTHPIPQKYYITHTRLGSWNSDQWQRMIAPCLSDEQTRIAYD